MDAFAFAMEISENGRKNALNESGIAVLEGT